MVSVSSYHGEEFCVLYILNYNRGLITHAISTDDKEDYFIDFAFLENTSSSSLDHIIFRNKKSLNIFSITDMNFAPITRISSDQNLGNHRLFVNRDMVVIDEGSKIMKYNI
mmetsp:Transcript_41888/g.40216  ORF Transcript_41888/g.40216 Transcript_41888/m.40216 type:complete len:111 (+) Transcript_41888:1789-2121(+)